MGHIRRKWLVLGNHEVAASEHTGGQVRGVESGAVEVAEHDVRFPPAHELDNRRVDIGTKEGHGAAGAKGTGADVGRGDSQRSTNVEATGTEREGQVVAGDLRATARGQENGEQRGGR
jgi:hypothetical protein